MQVYDLEDFEKIALFRRAYPELKIDSNFNVTASNYSARLDYVNLHVLLKYALDGEKYIKRADSILRHARWVYFLVGSQVISRINKISLDVE